MSQKRAEKHCPGSCHLEVTSTEQWALTPSSSTLTCDYCAVSCPATGERRWDPSASPLRQKSTSPDDSHTLPPRMLTASVRGEQNHLHFTEEKKLKNCSLLFPPAGDVVYHPLCQVGVSGDRETSLMWPNRWTELGIPEPQNLGDKSAIKVTARPQRDADLVLNTESKGFRRQK